MGLSSFRVVPCKGQVKNEGKLDILSHVGQQVLKDYFLKIFSIIYSVCEKFPFLCNPEMAKLEPRKAK